MAPIRLFDRRAGSSTSSFGDPLGPLASWTISWSHIRRVRRAAAGSGGMIFRADYLTESVALKQINSQVFDPTNLEDFSLELSMLARLSSHPGVVRFMGITKRTDNGESPEKDDGTSAALVDLEDGPQLFLVLQWCPRGHLGDMIATGIFRRNDKELKRIAREVCAAMAHIHSLSVVHRDLKPGNILINNGVAQVADFGAAIRWKRSTGRPTSLCRPSSVRSTTSGDFGKSPLLTKLVGTAAFVPPEAILGARRGMKPYRTFEEASKADIYAFGILLACMTLGGGCGMHGNGKTTPAFVGRYLYDDVEVFDDDFLMNVASGRLRPLLPTMTTPRIVSTWAPLCWAQDPDERPDFFRLAEVFCATDDDARNVPATLISVGDETIPLASRTNHKGAHPVEASSTKRPSVDV